MTCPSSPLWGRRLKQALPQQFPLLEPYLLRALNGEAISGLEVEVGTTPGEPRRMLVSYQPARDEGGEVVGIAGLGGGHYRARPDPGGVCARARSTIATAWS